jgi:hypothetical protein
MIFYVIFDGNKGGDWWTLFYGNQELLGRQRIKELSYLLCGATMHRHNKTPCPAKIPQSLLNNFYADTIRWCNATQFRDDIAKLDIIKKITRQIKGE